MRIFIRPFIVLFCLLYLQLLQAEIISSGSPELRLRMGTGRGAGGGTDTVEYAPGLPPIFTTLGGLTSEAEHASTNVISGGETTHTVRIVTDANRRGAGDAPVDATFHYDSSVGMICVTLSSCGTTTIPFTHIRWNAQDNDTLNSVLQYDGSTNQVFQIQSDSDASNSGTNNRHRNRYQFIYINNVVYPAGTYRGTVTASGTN